MCPWCGKIGHIESLGKSKKADLPRVNYGVVDLPVHANMMVVRDSIAQVVQVSPAVPEDPTNFQVCANAISISPPLWLYYRTILSCKPVHPPTWSIGGHFLRS